MNKACLLLGGNLGNVSLNFKIASEYMANCCGEITNKSNLYQSESWGFEAKELFLNQVLIIETKLTAQELLQETQSIEQKIGRKTKSQNQEYQSRLIDIDILFFEDDIIQTENLTIPHPRLHLRNFTLAPLHELIPNYIHPKLKKSISWLFENSKDKIECSLYR